MHTCVLKISFFVSFVLMLVSCGEKSTNSNLTKENQESCLYCHSAMKGFGDAHNPQAIGCSSCHLGNVNSFEKEMAHLDMIKIPGNLANASKTCSTTQCHKSELNRVNSSIMTTNSGIVSIDKFVFEEISHTDSFFNIENLQNSAADKHLKNLCFKCHLGYEKKHYGATSELSRGGGCLACHLNYNGQKSVKTDDIHPSIDLNIGDDKCFGCHSRSGRISTNYEGWYETLLTKDEVEDTSQYRILKDGRVFALAEDDVHHKAGLSCIDCHSSIDIMGDGIRHKHEDEAVKIQCTDCHAEGRYHRLNKAKAGNIAALDYALRKYKYKTEEFIITKKDSVALVNTGFDQDDNPFLIEKLNQKIHRLNPSPPRCQKDEVHKALDCNMCHTAWVSSCIGCHTAYDDRIAVRGKKKRGKWVEETGGFNKSKPVMGMSYANGKRSIKPAIPGMIMTLDKTNYKDVKYGHEFRFLRLFAPVSAHTTSSKSRSCKSCHMDSEALGYGKGTLSFDSKAGRWDFESLYDYSEYDSLPQDAWIGFMKKTDSATTYSAHQNFHPLDLKVREKILKVGSCIYCHPGDQLLMEKMVYGQYRQMIKKCDYYNKSLQYLSE